MSNPGLPNTNISWYTLQEGFKEYLTDLKSQRTDSEYSIENYSSISIFLYSKEFKDYIIDEVGLDSSVLSLNINDIVEMLTNEQETVEGSTAKDIGIEFDTEESDFIIDENNIMLELFNQVLSDNDVIDALDSDKNGTLSNDEINAFLNNINGLEDDLDPDSLSFEELAYGVQSIYDGTYSDLTTKTDEEELPDEETDIPETDSSSETTPVSNTSGTSSFGSVSNGNFSASNPTDNNQKNVEVNEENMTLEQLKDLVPNKEQAVSDAQTKFSELQNDKGEMAVYKDNMEKSYSQYLEELKTIDSNLAELVNAKKEEIDNQEALINQKKIDISNKECEVSDLEVSYDNAVSTKQSLEDSLSSLKSLDLSKYSESQKAQIESNISDLENNKIPKAQQDIDTIKEKLDKAKEELNKMKTGEDDSLDSLEAKLDLLNGTNEGQMGNLEQQVSSLCDSNPNLKSLKNAYDTQKDIYIQKKAELTSSAQNEITKTQEALNKTNRLIGQKESEKTTKQYNNLIKGDLFTDSNLSIQKINNGNMSYLLIGPEDADSDEELPVLFYLHGAGQVGKSLDALEQHEYDPAVIMQNWDLSNFRGYIICPQLKGGSWNSQSAENQLRQLYQDFSSTHSINKDKVCVAGASLGAQGSLYMATAMNDIFSKAASFSPYNPGNLSNEGTGIPTRVFAGSNDDQRCVRYVGQLQNVFGEDNCFIVNGESHNSLPGAVFRTDSDGNGRSDVLEWLFSD